MVSLAVWSKWGDKTERRKTTKFPVEKWSNCQRSLYSSVVL